MRDTTGLAVSAAGRLGRRHDDDDDDRNDHQAHAGDHEVELHVLPPHCFPELGGALLELGRICLELVCQTEHKRVKNTA